MSNNAIRIQKVLSSQGILSRRKAEEAIQQGRILVNGRPASIGQKIHPHRDILTLDGVALTMEKNKKKVYLMLHKPRGYITTTRDDQGRNCVIDLVKDAPAKVYPVGRLDRQSEGLLLLTNDGQFANQIMHPGGQVAKTYRVTVRSAVTEPQLVQLSAGVNIDGRRTLPASAHLLSSSRDRSVIQLTIREGRNRQVRKMCEAVGLTVARLKRNAVGPLKLGMLPPGQWRELTSDEVLAFKNAMKKAESAAPDKRSSSSKKRRASKSRR